MKTLLLALLATLSNAPLPPAQSALEEAAADSQSAALWHGGRIHLGDGSTVEALLVRGGRIVEVGPTEELLAAAPDAARRDLAGAVVVPGLHDAHGHLEGYAAGLEEVSLVGVASFAELIERVSEQASRQAPGTWVVGRGWDQTLWEGGAFPNHAALSAATPDHPVLLSRVDGHCALANLRALAAAGLADPATPLPEVDGGRLLVDDAGRPTGVLVDKAMGLVGRFLPEPDRATRLRRLQRAQQELVALGLVAVHDMGSPPSTVELLRELEATGGLDLRVFVYLSSVPPTEELEQFVAGPEPAGNGATESRVVVQGVKLMVDGALGSRGAALLADYADEPGHRGLSMWEPAALRARVAELTELGLQPATHAIGDAANRMVLEAYAEVARKDQGLTALRPRIEHAQVVAPEDWLRFAAQGVVPSVQPTHATTDMRWAGARLGPERLVGAYAWRRIAPNTAALALGSDFPVESPAPLLGLYAARTRQDAAGEPVGGWFPDQRLSGAEALAGFTSGAAHAVRREADLGRLLPGYRADFVVLDTDPVEADPARLLEARVLLTVIEGEIVYARD